MWPSEPNTEILDCGVLKGMRLTSLGAEAQTALNTLRRGAALEAHLTRSPCLIFPDMFKIPSHPWIYKVLQAQMHSIKSSKLKRLTFNPSSYKWLQILEEGVFWTGKSVRYALFSLHRFSSTWYFFCDLPYLFLLFSYDGLVCWKRWLFWWCWRIQSPC